MSTPDNASEDQTERWLLLGAKLLGICDGILHDADIGAGRADITNPRVVALTLLLRTANNFHAVRTLLTSGIVVEARTITRCMYENLFWLAGLTGDADAFIGRIVQSDAKHRLAQGNELLAWANKQTTPADFGVQFEEFLADLKKEHPKPIDVQFKTAAEAGNVGEGYIFYRVLSTDSAHPSASSLSRHLSYDENTNVLTFHAEPIQDDGEVEDTAELACIALLGVCVGANNLLGETAAGAKLQSSFDEWKVLWRNKAGR